MTNRTVTAVPGCLAGHATHESGSTGVTALLFPDGATAGHTIPGQAPGSRELAALSPQHITHSIHGLCFAGGSVFGLSAADGVVQFLHEQGTGMDTGHDRVPIVPAAIIYDLDGTEHRPAASHGYEAARAADTAPLRDGRFGVGAGARVARLSGQPVPSGIGNWAEQVRGWTVSVVAVVNAVGSIIDPASGTVLAGTGERGILEFAELPLASESRGHTTLVAVVTDAPLTRPQATILARMASSGIHRTHFPSVTPFDGDIVFAASPDRPGRSPLASPTQLAELGHAAAWTAERAVVRAISSSS